MKNVVMSMEMPHDSSYVGGIATILNQYIRELAKFNNHGYDISLFSYQNKRISCIKNTKLQNIIYAVFQMKAIYSYTQTEAIDIVHIHSSRKWMLFRDILQARYLKRKGISKVLLSIHFADIDRILYKNKLIRNYEIYFLRKYVDRIILLSEKTFQEFYSKGIPSTKMEVLYTFHDYEDQTKIEKNNATKQIVFIGSIDARKGIIDLLEVLCSLKHEFVIHVCGQVTDNAIKARFEELARILGNKIQVHGYVSGKEKEEVLSNADILVLPSYAEGVPIVLFEAMAFSCGIITTPVGGIPEIIKSDNGILIPPGDKEALMQAISLLLQDNMILKSMQEENYEKSRNFGLNNNINKLCGVYSSLYD